MAINFPNNPAVNDTFTVGGTTFTFTGVKWETSAVVEISSDTTPTLGGDLDAATYNINNVGIITATTFSGNVTGTATNAQGLTGDPSIQVTNATVLGNLDVQGTTTTIDTAVTEVDSLAVDGSVGIGTTNPNRLLHLKAASSTAYSGGSDTADYNFLKIENTTDDKSAGVFFQIGSNGEAAITATEVADGNTDIAFQNRGGGVRSEKVRITSGGQLNIGDDLTNSTYLISSRGTGHNRIEILSTDNNSAGIYLRTFNSGSQVSSATVRTDNSGNLQFYTATSGSEAERLRITDDDITSTVPFSDSMGPLRRLGINNHNAATYTLVASDAGKLIREATNSANITIPQNVFSAGDMITIFNVSGGNNTITSGAGITLYNTADGATGNRTLAAKGVCTIACTSTNEFIISGSGLS